MRHLTAQEILYLHDRLIEETGGAHGVRDLGTLEMAVARPQAGYGRIELYEGLFRKAGALLEALISAHPFVDGNKRTAITAAGLFLELNGRRLVATSAELETFALDVATSTPGASEIAQWLEARSELL